MKKQLKGKIISDKMDKTRVVLVEEMKEFPKYRKHFRVTKKFKADDKKNEYKIGDLVIIEETRPLSKEKHWRIVSRVANK